MKPTVGININPGVFGGCSKVVVEKILYCIVDILESASGITSPRPFCVTYKPDGPMCSNTGQFRTIFLCVTGDYWGQWAYQFAHEYCHHLIDGPMTGERRGLFWFEETVCELASRYAIARLATPSLCNKWDLHIANHILRNYHHAHLHLDATLAQDLEQNRSVVPWLPLLSEPQYHRRHYAVMAQTILPLFLEQPHLWQIIGLIGDSRQYESLEVLLYHLESNADKPLLPSLRQLRCLLVGH